MVVLKKILNFIIDTPMIACISELSASLNIPKIINVLCLIKKEYEENGAEVLKKLKKK